MARKMIIRNRESVLDTIITGSITGTYLGDDK